jgi:hypothetical protein
VKEVEKVFLGTNVEDGVEVGAVMISEVEVGDVKDNISR